MLDAAGKIAGVEDNILAERYGAKPPSRGGRASF